MPIMLLMVLALALGCSRAPQVTHPNQSAKGTILEQVLLYPEHSNVVASAQRDLPTDEWSDRPFRHNVSRGTREMGIATEMLEEIRPKLKRMNVDELVSSLKLVDYTSGTVFPGVAGYVYAWGNEDILKELRSRPKVELAALRRYRDSKMEIYAGIQAQPWTLGDLLKYDDILGK